MKSLETPPATGSKPEDAFKKPLVSEFEAAFDKVKEEMHGDQDFLKAVEQLRQSDFFPPKINDLSQELFRASDEEEKAKIAEQLKQAIIEEVNSSLNRQDEQMSEAA